MSKLLGFMDGTGKTGKPYTLAYLVSDLSANEVQRGAVGQKVEQVFLPVSQVGTLTAKDINCEVKLDYSVSGGRAFLNSFEIVRK